MKTISFDNNSGQIEQTLNPGEYRVTGIRNGTRILAIAKIDANLYSELKEMSNLGGLTCEDIFVTGEPKI